MMDILFSHHLPRMNNGGLTEQVIDFLSSKTTKVFKKFHFNRYGESKWPRELRYAYDFHLELKLRSNAVVKIIIK